MTKKKQETELELVLESDLTLNKYEENAHSTIANSTQDHLDVAFNPELIGILRRFVDIARTIDTYKKAAFYGRGIESFPTPLKPVDRRDLPFQFIHGVLGLAGESGEVVELLLSVLDGAVSFEEAGPLIREELGDELWYLAVAARANDPEGGIEGVAKFNNEKLFKRWGDRPIVNDFQDKT